MAAISGEQVAKLMIGKKSTISIPYDEWQKAAKNKKRVDVIVSNCYLDMWLKHLLELIFMRWNEEVRNQFDPNGGSLAYLPQKAKLVYSLGCIDKTTLVDLKQMNKIRNLFAHNVNITFTDAEVCKLMDRLSVAKDSKVTTKDKYSIYILTLHKCWKAISAAIEQETIRKAVLKQSDKEKKC